jgi:hypothetical protein
MLQWGCRVLGSVFLKHTFPSAVLALCKGSNHAPMPAGFGLPVAPPQAQFCEEIEVRIVPCLLAHESMVATPI